MIDIGGILGAGIRLVRERPGAVAVWVVINILFSGVMQVAMLPMMQVLTSTRAGLASPAVMLAAMGPFYGAALLVLLAQIVVSAAVYRACLRPDESAAAYLRLGGDELRLFVISLLWAALSFVVLLIGGVIVGAGFAASDSSGAGSTASILTTVLGMFGFFLLALVLFIFLGVRFALAWPLAIQRKRILLGEAWRLSRGHFWAMFASALVVLVVLYAGSTMVNMLQFGAMALPGMAATDPEAANRLMIEQFTALTPLRIVIILLSGVLTAGYLIAMTAGLAEALKQLQPDSDESLADIYA